MIGMEKRTYRLHGMTRILVRRRRTRRYTASSSRRRPQSWQRARNRRLCCRRKTFETKGLTVFLRDDGVLCLADYVVKGFLKEALGVLKSQIKIGSPASKVDNLILVEPDYIHFTRGGKPVTEADEIF